MDEVKHVYQIGGVKVEFPYKAYGPQLAYMGKVVATLEKAHRDPSSHCNALLESPTGTGKTLSLLCAALAWQQHRKAMPAPTLVSQPGSEGLGGGFIPEESAPDIEQSNNLANKKKKVPTIFFATRTHSQISQIVHEYRKTKYCVPMAVLAARKHYCTNKHVAKKNNIDEECKLLLKDENHTCPYFKNVNKLKNHSSLKKGGSHEIHDIEDLVKLGHTVRGCAYFAAQLLAAEAELVFSPYGYILNPVIRKAMDIDIRGAIIILDEAHNIEDLACEAGSIDLERTSLEEMRAELEQISLTANSSDIYQPLIEMITEMLVWIDQQESSLSKMDFERFCSCWTGDKALHELCAAGISLESFPMLLECAQKIIAEAADPDLEERHLSGHVVLLLEGLFSALKFMLFSPARSHDYQLVVQKYVKRDEAMGVQGWVCSLSLWCLNPAVVFDDVAKKSRAVILTSGTLSPMDSFTSELGVPFEVVIEAPHVIDMNKQLLAVGVSVGPGNVHLNASYKHADGFSFQDELGAALEQIFRVVPAGALVFFPSYKLVEKLCCRWKATGQWQKLLKWKELFVEPRGKQDSFDRVLNSYYKAIAQNRKCINGDGKQSTRKSLQKSKENVPLDAHGAAFLAVCRGKVSEGINFSDENARVVIVVGIPFPNIKDIRINLKKQYNNKHKVSRKLLSGDEWYCHQAFRALNQAIGRCIRHRHDYGAIVLLDERFKNSRNTTFMSKWLRNSIKQTNDFNHCLDELRLFYKMAEEFKCKEVLEKSSIDLILPSSPSPGLNLKPKKTNSTRKISLCQTSQSVSQCTRSSRKVSSPVVSEPYSVCINACENTDMPGGTRDEAEDKDPCDITSMGTCVPLTSSLPSRDQEHDTQYLSRRNVNNSIDMLGTADLYGIVLKETYVPSTLVTPSMKSSLSDGPSCRLSRHRGNEICNDSSFVVALDSQPLKGNYSQGDKPGSSWPCMNHRDAKLDKNIIRSLPMHESISPDGGADNDDGGGYALPVSTADYLSSPVPNSGLQFIGSDLCLSKTPTRCEGMDQISSCDTPAVATSSNHLVSREYIISCCICGHYLSAPGKSCLSCTSSILDFSYLGFLIDCNSRNCTAVRKPDLPIHALVTEFLDLDLCKSSTRNASLLHSQGCSEAQGQLEVWVEEDGSVFEPVTCAWCEDHNIFLGVHVVAAGEKNKILTGKVVLFNDYIKAVPLETFQSPYQQLHVNESGNKNNKRLALSSSAKGKLKLPRRICKE